MAKIFKFNPYSDVACKETPYYICNDKFTSEELDKIISYGDTLISTEALEAKVSQGEKSVTLEKLRKCKLAWIRLNDETRWMYRKLSEMLSHINGEFFQFDIDGFAENLQYTVYESSTSAGGDHYDWHFDKGYHQGHPPRKLSLSLLLNSPSDYEGGELQIKLGSLDTQVQKNRGLIAVFPSYILHRVTPVTKGVRKSLVVWACGHKFR